MAANLNSCRDRDGGTTWDLDAAAMEKLDALGNSPAADEAFRAHFSKRAVIDETGPTLALGYGPVPEQNV